MEKQTLYRVDSYYDHSGELIGFFPTLDDVTVDLLPLNEEDQAQHKRGELGNYIQVTEFTAPAELSGKEAWSNGEVVRDLYFQEEK